MKRLAIWSGILATLFSLAVLGLAIHQGRGVGVATVGLACSMSAWIVARFFFPKHSSASVQEEDVTHWSRIDESDEDLSLR